MTPPAVQVSVDDATECVDREALEIGWAAAAAEDPRFAEFALGVSMGSDADEGLHFSVQIECAEGSAWCAGTWRDQDMNLPAQPIARADCPVVADAALAKAKEHLRDLLITVCDEHPLACAGDGARRSAPWTVAVSASGGPTLRAPALGVEAARELPVGRVRPTLGARLAVGAPVDLVVVIPGCRLPDSPACTRRARSAVWSSLSAAAGATVAVGPAWASLEVSGGLLLAGGQGFPEGQVGAAPIGAARLSSGVAAQVAPFAAVEGGWFPAFTAEYAEPVPLPTVRVSLGVRATIP